MGDDNEVNKAVGETVRAALLSAGSNVRTASDAAGLNYRTVRRYVAGERDMPVPVLLALARASGIDLARLVQQLEQTPTLSPADAASDPGTGQGEGADAASDAMAPPQMEGDPRGGMDATLQQLGVTRLAARSIAAIDETELAAVLEVVQRIVLELRQDRQGEAVVLPGDPRAD